MSGPPYPPPPAPGSNQIGAQSFSIGGTPVGGFDTGVSPIGDIPPFNVWTTVIRQYANSPIVDGVANAFAAAMDMTQSFDNLYDFIWNVLTAQGYGLDVWGRIVDVTRVVQIPTANPGQYIGFQETGDPAHFTGFGQAPFFTGGQLTNNFSLQDADFRRLILAKAATNVCDGSTPAANAILLALFPNRGACYVTDPGGMQMTYTFAFAISSVELAIVNQPGVLPKSVGVTATVVQP